MQVRVLAAFMGALSIGGFAFAQGAPDPRPGATTPVQVVNTDANPVPVRIPGGVAISGDVEIVNTSPIAVTVVPPPVAGEVICRTGVASSGPGSWPGFGLASSPNCGAGVIGLDIHRIILDPNSSDPFNATFASRDYQIYNAIVGIGPLQDTDIRHATAILGALTQSQLEKTLPTPVRIMFASQGIVLSGKCGAPGVATTICGHEVLIIGVPIR
jgi:hypothetical protein